MFFGLVKGFELSNEKAHSTNIRLDPTECQSHYTEPLNLPIADLESITAFLKKNTKYMKANVKLKNTHTRKEV